jgi:hypothetical protein
VNIIDGWILLACSKNSSSSFSLCIHCMSTSSINRKRLMFRWDDDDVHFVLDKKLNRSYWVRFVLFVFYR